MAAAAVAQPQISQIPQENPKDKALQDYRKKLLEHKEIEGRLKESKRFASFVLILNQIVNSRCLVLCRINKIGKF